jgi:uroporphyrinogen decarboxylase
VDLHARGSAEEVQKKTRETIEKAAPGGGYCAGSGNSIPEYVRMENYLAMIDEVKKFRY